MPRGPSITDPILERRANLELGWKLRAAREKRGLTQTQLGKKAGIDATVISAVENGWRSLALRQLRAIGKALKVRPGDFL